MSADQLLNHIMNVSLAHNNDFAGSVREAQRLMEKNWSTERQDPVLLERCTILTLRISEPLSSSSFPTVFGPFHKMR
jgi:hypothetical protein